MKKKLVKYGKILLAITLIGALALPSYATVGASDGSAFVTKAEFDAALSDFNARLTTFEAGINSKIDSQVSSYLDRNGIWSGKKQILKNIWPTSRVTVYFDAAESECEPLLKSTTVTNKIPTEIVVGGDSTLSEQSEKKLRVTVFKVTSNDKGCIDLTSNDTPEDGSTSITNYLLNQTFGPWYEHQARGSYKNLMYFECTKTGLAHIQFKTNPTINNSQFDSVFWANNGNNNNVLVRYAGNMSQYAMIKEWHLLGFRDYSLDTSGKITKPVATDIPIEEFTISVHNVAVPAVRGWDNLNNVSNTDAGTGTYSQVGMKGGWWLTQYPAFTTNVSNFAFVQKGNLYVFDIYSGFYDLANRTNFAINNRPYISYRNTDADVVIY